MAYIGVNNDKYSVWRNTERKTEIGFVHLALRMILLSLQDYFFGEVQQVMSASIFFNGNSQDSTYNYWCQVLDVEPDTFISVIREFEKTGQQPPKEFWENLDRLYNNMTIDKKQS